MASNPKNKPRASREVEKPSIEPILPPMVEEMCGQDIWNNCAVCSVVSGVMGATSSLSPSFGKCGGEGGPIAYTLSPSLPLKGLKTADPPSPFCERTSVCLVHLGGRDFCFVETGQSEYLADIQHIGVTTFEIVDDGEEGNPMINTLHSTVYAVDTSDLQTFDIDFGFATWLDDVEPEGEIMTLLIEQEETEWKETSLEELNWGVADACQLTKGEGEVKKKSGQGKGKKKSRSGK